MTVTAHTSGHWAAAHRTALLVLLLAAAIAAAAAVLIVRLISSAVPVPASTTPSVSQLQPAGDTCQVARSGQPC